MGFEEGVEPRTGHRKRYIGYRFRFRWRVRKLGKKIKRVGREFLTKLAQKNGYWRGGNPRCTCAPNVRACANRSG